MAENETKSTCTGSCSSCGHKCSEDPAEQQIRKTIGAIHHQIVVMSGKGGVGKSTVSVNLAFALALAGKRVGLLDVDIHGPSIPKMVHLEGTELVTENDRLIPAAIGSLKVMSIGFLLANADDPVVWRGPVKAGVIKQFLSEVDWGELDYLVVDAPPGTGDEPLSICQLLPGADGAVIVTTPQDVAAADVAKSVKFCNQLNFRVLGIVENMSGFVCPHCGEITEIFAGSSGTALAEKYNVPFLGKIPLDPAVCQGGDAGKPFIYFNGKSATAKIFAEIVEKITGVATI